MTIHLVGSNPPLQHSTLSRVLTAIANGLRTADEQLSRRVQQRFERALLMELPDHMLSDIGISRSAIAYAVRYGREVDRIRDEGRL